MEYKDSNREALQRREDQHSFVICAYKESAYLEECILSLLNQSVRSNILLATSTPNEYIKRLVKKYEIPMYINRGESGIAQDWNFALECADTSFVTIAHQDDIYERDYCKDMMRLLKSQKNPIIGFCDYYELRNGKAVTESSLLKTKRFLLFPLKQKRFWSSIFIRRRVLSFGSAICCPSVTLRKSRLTKPTFQPGMKSNVDWQAWEKLSKKKGQFVYCDKMLMAHRIHEESETTAVIQANSRGQEDYEMFRHFWPGVVAKMLTKLYSKSEKFNQVDS